MAELSRYDPGGFTTPGSYSLAKGDDYADALMALGTLGGTGLPLSFSYGASRAFRDPQLIGRDQSIPDYMGIHGYSKSAISDTLKRSPLEYLSPNRLRLRGDDKSAPSNLKLPAEQDQLHPFSMDLFKSQDRDRIAERLLEFIKVLYGPRNFRIK